MAAECFCGYGRRVRFGRKRASGHGAEVRWLLVALETVVVPMAGARGTPHQRAELSRLIADGQSLEGLFQGMAHGLSVAPPPISGISGWFHDAKRITRAFEGIRAGRQSPEPGSESPGTATVADDDLAFPPLPPTTPDMDPTAVADARAMHEAGRAFFERHAGTRKAADARDADCGNG